MAPWILIAWTYFAAVVSLVVGLWAAIVPYGSIWVGIVLALQGIGLGFGISLYLWGESAPRRLPLSAKQASMQTSSKSQARYEPALKFAGTRAIAAAREARIPRSQRVVRSKSVGEDISDNHGYQQDMVEASA